MTGNIFWTWTVCFTSMSHWISGTFRSILPSNSAYRIDVWFVFSDTFSFVSTNVYQHKMFHWSFCGLELTNATCSKILQTVRVPIGAFAVFWTGYQQFPFLMVRQTWPGNGRPQESILNSFICLRIRKISYGQHRWTGKNNCNLLNTGVNLLAGFEK